MEEKTIDDWRRFVRGKRMQPGVHPQSQRIQGAQFKAASEILAKIDNDELRTRITGMFNTMTKYDALGIALSDTHLGREYPDQALQLAEAVAGHDYAITPRIG